MLRFWEEQAPFLGKTCSVFGRNRLRFWNEQAPFLGQSGSVRSLGVNLVRFLDWLGTSSSLAVLNAKHVWVWIFEGLGLGVTKSKPSGGKLEG